MQRSVQPLCNPKGTTVSFMLTFSHKLGRELFTKNCRCIEERKYSSWFVSDTT
jgi:hypothetical protein